MIDASASLQQQSENVMTLVAICRSDDDPELGEGEEEESAVADAAKKQIPRAKSWLFGMTRSSAKLANTSPQ
jgi:hypothetical protein